METILHLKDNGRRIPSRNGEMVEVLDHQIVLPDIEYCVTMCERRRFNPFYACAEVSWYFEDTDDATFLLRFAPSYKQYLEEDGKTAYWAYGPRFVKQLEHIVNLLYADPWSRRAVISLWNEADLDHATNETKVDVPCVTQFQFFVRDQKLLMTTTQRSQDMWVGFPYDVFAFTCVQRVVASRLNLKCGAYTHKMGSCHFYTKHEGKIDYSIRQIVQSGCEVMPVEWTNIADMRNDIQHIIKGCGEVNSSCMKEIIRRHEENERIGKNDSN